MSFPIDHGWAFALANHRFLSFQLTSVWYEMDHVISNIGQIFADTANEEDRGIWKYY